MRDHGYEQEVIGYSVGGKTAQTIAENELPFITAFMGKYKSELCIISAGGNDLLQNADISMTTAELDALNNEIASNMLKIVEAVKIGSSQTEIIILGLDYPNFVDSLENPLWGEINEGYWDKLGQPTPLQINTLLANMGQKLMEMCENSRKCYYSNNHGYLQYKFGVGIEPGNYPDYQNFMGGDPNEPTPKEMMEHHDLVDSIHPSGRGYYLISERLILNFMD